MTRSELENQITLRQWHLLQYTLGARCDRPRDGWGYRNYFTVTTDEERQDMDNLLRLDLMERIPTRGPDTYRATRRGEELIFG